MAYWLIKSEGDCYSIDDLKKDRRTSWEGVRNFQARNFMRDGMKIGDLVLFYHSSSQPNGVYGVAKVVSKPHTDESSLNTKDEHYDPRAVLYMQQKKDPLWICVDMEFSQKFTEPVSLETIKKDPELRGMLVTQIGQRLSVMPVEEKHFKKILKIGQKK